MTVLVASGLLGEGVLVAVYHVDEGHRAGAMVVDDGGDEGRKPVGFGLAVSVQVHQNLKAKR